MQEAEGLALARPHCLQFPLLIEFLECAQLHLQLPLFIILLLVEVHQLLIVPSQFPCIAGLTGHGGHGDIQQPLNLHFQSDRLRNVPCAFPKGRQFRLLRHSELCRRIDYVELVADLSDSRPQRFHRQGHLSHLPRLQYALTGVDKVPVRSCGFDLSGVDLVGEVFSVQTDELQHGLGHCACRHFEDQSIAGVGSEQLRHLYTYAEHAAL